MSSFKSKIAWVSAAVLVIGVGVFLGRQTSTSEELNGDDGSGEPEISRRSTTNLSQEEKRTRNLERQRKAQALRKLLQNAQNSDDVDSKKPSNIPLGDMEMPDISKIDPVQRHTLTMAMESVYNPDELKAALDDGSVLDYMKEASAKLKEMTEGETIEVNQSEIEVTEEMRMALSRMQLLTRYTANISHAMRPSDLELQNQHILRINRAFEGRFEILNQYYPFLNAEMMIP